MKFPLIMSDWTKFIETCAQLQKNRTQFMERNCSCQLVYFERAYWSVPTLENVSLMQALIISPKIAISSHFPGVRVMFKSCDKPSGPIIFIVTVSLKNS